MAQEVGMAIAFSCSCGKQLRAREEFAGRKIKCPGCQTVLVIPAPAPVEVSAPAATEIPPALPVQEPILPDDPPLVPLVDPVSLKAPDTMMPLARPAVAAAPETARIRPAAVNAALPNPWVDRSLEQTATPWLGNDREHFNGEREARQGSHLWLALAAVVLFAVLGLIAAFFFDVIP
jgi:hypothetical protein